MQRIGELLRRLCSTAATVPIAGHNMHFCLGLASPATVIDGSQIVYTSFIDELKANDSVRQRYRALEEWAFVEWVERNETHHLAATGF